MWWCAKTQLVLCKGISSWQFMLLGTCTSTVHTCWVKYTRTDCTSDNKLRSPKSGRTPKKWQDNYTTMHWPKVRCKHAVNANTSVHSSTQNKALVKEPSLSTTTTGQSFVFCTLYTRPCLTSQLYFQLLSKHTGAQQPRWVFRTSYFMCSVLPNFSAILLTSQPSLSSQFFSPHSTNHHGESFVLGTSCARPCLTA